MAVNRIPPAFRSGVDSVQPWSVVPARMRPPDLTGSAGTGIKKYHLDPLRIAIFALVVVSLSRIHVHLGLRTLRPALILALVAGAYALVSPHLTNTRNLVRYWPAKAIIALGVLACVSAPFGLSLGGSATFILEHYSKVLILAFLLIAAIRSVRDLSFFVWAFVVSCGLLAYFALFVFELQTSPGYASARLGDLYTYDANDVSCILMSGLPLVLVVFQASKLKGKLFAGAILIGIGATLARTGSRGGFIGFLVVGLALLMLVPRVSVLKRIGFVGAAVAGLMLYAPPGYWEQMRTIQNPTEDYNWTSVDGRKSLAERGMGYMKANPFLGLGIDNFARAEGTISEKAQNFVNKTGARLRWTAPHNSFVQVGAELGIPGLLLWSFLLFGGIVGMYRLRRRLPKAWARGDPDHRFLYGMTVYMPVALLGFAATSFFVSFAYADPLYILTAFVAGLYLTVDYELRRWRPPVPRSPVTARRMGRPVLNTAVRRPVPPPF